MIAMKIAVFNASEKDRNEIEAAFPSEEVSFFNGSIEDNIELIKDFEAISIFVGNPVSADAIKELPNLKLIVTRSTGFDHIDLEAAKEAGVVVLNVTSYGERTVAEFAFALIMTISRKVADAYDRLRRSGDTDVEHFEGFDLVNKKIGIVGTGKIGRNAARIAHGFGMQVLLFDIHEDPNFASEIDGRYLSLEELVAQSDIITIHVPYNDHTHHLINADLLSKFKKGSLLINTSRGAVVCTADLLEALKSGQIGGAGLDVVEGEEDFRDDLTLLLKETNDIEKFREIIAAHELVDMDNVIVTPHIAFNTREAKDQIVKKTIQNIKDYIEGNTESNLAK